MSNKLLTLFTSALIALLALTSPADAQSCFIRGDADDDGALTLADAIRIVNWLFSNGPAPPCEAAADANDDGTVDLSDAIFILQNRFLGGPQPPPPYPACGPDPTSDSLSCNSSSCFDVNLRWQSVVPAWAGTIATYFDPFLNDTVDILANGLLPKSVVLEIENDGPDDVAHGYSIHIDVRRGIFTATGDFVPTVNGPSWECSQAGPPIAAGSSEFITFSHPGAGCDWTSVPYGILPPGLYRGVVTADHGDQLGELDESDNVDHVFFEIPEKEH